MKKLFSLLTLLILSTSCASSGHSLVFTDYGSKAYTQKSLNQYIKILKKGDLKHADLLYTCYTADTQSHTVDCDSFSSPRRSVFKAIAKDLKKEGFYLSLRHYIDLKNQKWRAYWKPKNTKKAFSHIERELVRFSKLASQVNADQIFIGSEYEGLVSREYQESWKEIIKKIRKHFKGKVLYAANGNPNGTKKPEYTWNSLWGLVDKVAINYYPSFKGEINEKTLKAHHKKEIKKLVSFSKNLKKELILSEVGFPLAKKGIYTPYEWRYQANDMASSQLRDLSLGLFLKEVHHASIKEVHLWRYLPKEEELHPLGYIIDQSYLSTLKKRP